MFCINAWYTIKITQESKCTEEHYIVQTHVYLSFQQSYIYLWINETLTYSDSSRHQVTELEIMFRSSISDSKLSKDSRSADRFGRLDL